MCSHMCAWEKHSETCVQCSCVGHFFGGVWWAIALLHTKWQKIAIFCLNCYHVKSIYDFFSHLRALKKINWRISKNQVQNYCIFDVKRGYNKNFHSILQKVRMWSVTTVKFKRVRCMRATEKMVATHSLQFCTHNDCPAQQYVYYGSMYYVAGIIFQQADIIVRA